VKKNISALFIIFLIALIARFLFFRDSTYFGYDEARDAFISQDIYKNLDFKIIGPPANFPGIFHGPLFWYFIGPLYILGGGNPYIVSAVFRIINALGVFIVYLIAKKLFNRPVSYFAAFIYAVSFEQTQYAMYVGNPSLAVFSFLGIFLGAVMIFKDKNYKGLILMFVSAAIAMQLEFILAYTFLVVLVLIIILRKNLKHLNKKYWLYVTIPTLLILSTFIIAEAKFGFQITRGMLHLATSGYNVMGQEDTRFTLYAKMFAELFQYNIFNLARPYVYLFILPVIFYLFFLSRKNHSARIVLVWMFSALFLLPFGGYDAFYVNVGIGVSIIIALAFILLKIAEKSKASAYIMFLVIFLSNFLLIFRYNRDGLIVQIKAQQFMKLNDEISLIDKIYHYADGKGFTLRVTSMPYKVQTVWAYLFTHFGQKKWGYLPYWEGEEVMGYPGHLPGPVKGTTCIRFLIREPVRGIPEVLINKDKDEENLFSDIIKVEKIGEFLLEIRKAKGECHNLKPSVLETL